MIENMLIYKAVRDGYVASDTVYYLPYRFITGYPKLANGFHYSSRRYAKMIISAMHRPSDKRILADFYANENDSVLIRIQDKKIAGSYLYDEYQKYVSQIIKDSFSIKFGVITGLWKPTDNLTVVGDHISAGFMMGVRGLGGWSVDLNMMQRFQDMPDSINLYFNDTSNYFTDKYIGGFYGIDISRTIFANLKNEFDISLGVAIDGFNSTYDLPDNQSFLETSIHSFNFNAGCAYRFILQQSYFAEFQLRYNFLNYHNKNGADLSGNAITLNLYIGFLSGGRTRQDILRSLNYKF